MDTRTFLRRGLGPLVAGLATGCATLGGSGPEPPAAPQPVSIYPLVPAPATGATARAAAQQPAAEGKSPPGLTDNAAPPPAPPHDSWAGLVTPAEAAAQPPAQPGPGVPPPAAGGQPLSPPRPLPPTGTPGPGQPGWRPAAPPGPHVRSTPTAAGARLGLAPWEVPTDRVVELTKQLDAASAAHQELLNRIRELEALGAGREQALAEAFREAEAAAAEVALTRGQLREMAAEVTALREKIRRLEEEDIATLRAVIAALDRLLPPPRRD